MNILIDCSNIRTGGAIQNALTFIRKAKNDNYAKDFYLICSPQVDIQLDTNDKVVFKDYFAIKKLDGPLDIIKNSLFLSRYAKKMKPSLVFTLAGPAYWKADCTHIMGFARPHFIYPEIDIFYRYNFFSKIYFKIKLNFKNILLKYFFMRANYLVCQTEAVKDRIISALNFPKKNIYIIRNGYSIIFKDEIKKIDVIKKKELKKIFFVPSAYYVHKNLEILPIVARKLVDKNYDFLFKVTINVNENNSRSLKKLIAKYDVEKNFIFLGSLNHKRLAKEYILSDLVLLPTLLECSTAVYPEAFISKVPLLTSKLDFSVENCGDAAIYFDPFSSDDIVRKIEQLINNEKLSIKVRDLGEKILDIKYLTPEQKFDEQMKLFNLFSNNKK
jgi:hypothetical protein